MKTWKLHAILFLSLSPLIFFGCAADELTGLEPTPTPSGTPGTATPTSGPGTPTAPPATATPTPTRTPATTPTPEPGGRSFQGTCFNTGMQQEAGYITFNVYEDGQVTGEIYLEFMCRSSEPPYDYSAYFVTDFVTVMSGDTFSWDWISPSPAYNQHITLSGTVGETTAEGNWTYYYHLNSQHYSAICEGEGTWTASGG